MLKGVINTEQDLCIIKGAGHINLQMVIDVIASVYNSVDWHPAQNVLVDQREVLQILPFEDFQHIPAFIRATKILPNTKHAYLCKNGFNIVAGKMWEPFAKACGQQYKVFTDLNEACEWLDVSPQAVDGFIKTKFSDSDQKSK